MEDAIKNYEDVDSWKTVIFLYNAAMKEVGTKPRTRKASEHGRIQSTTRHVKPCGNERGPPRKAKYSLVTDSA